jgi:glycolate oxidase
MKDNPYSSVTEDVAAAIVEICGATNVLYDHSAKMDRYARDQVSEKKYAHPPELVAKPRTVDEVRRILGLAHRKRIPVTPRGAGSGLSGGAVPVYGGICLSLERMNSILEIDTDNLVGIVEPGVITRDFDRELQKHGLFFAGYPLSREICFLGGNVAENAGGGRAVKYGVTSHYITGLEMVTPDGEVVRFGGKRFKDVTGYSMLQLLIGSEGTLGVFTKIWIRLVPRPRYRMVLLALFEDVDCATGAIPQVMIEGRIVPSAIEFMDRLCFQEACKSLGESLPYEQAGASLLFEVDGSHLTSVSEECGTIEEICRKSGAVQVFAVSEPDQMERFWKIRERIPWVLRSFGSHQTAEDIVIPVSSIPRLLEETERIAETYGIVIANFGHAGDGNFHTTPIKNPDQSEEQWDAIIPEILTELYRIVAELGGTISGEHGIGHKRKRYMPLVMGEAELKMMRAIKNALDPLKIMNPGKIFD